MPNNIVRVWDPAVRIFHWSLLGLFILAYFTGDGNENLHAYAGYGISILLIFRFIWGVIGSQYARFSDFLVGPIKVFFYGRSLLRGQPAYFIGHDPIGGWMIVTLLSSISLTCWSGLELLAIDNRGPLAEVYSLKEESRDDHHKNKKEHTFDRHHYHTDKKDFWNDFHEFFANLTVLLILLHVSGVILSSFLHRENLIYAMLTGLKHRIRPPD